MEVKLKLKEQAKLKAHREGRTITKYTVHQEANLAFNTVDAYWENRVRRIDLDVITKLCEYFECKFEDLVQSSEVVRDFAPAG